MGPTPQGKAMAQRAALMDARRNLGENILGVRIDSSTYVRDFVTVSDEISSRFQGFLRGSREVSSREVEPCLFEVTVEITLTELGDIVLSGQQAKGYTPQPSYAPSSSSSYAPPAPSGYGSSGYGSSAPSSTPLPGSPYSGPRYNAPQPGGAGVSAPAQPGPIRYNEVPGSLAP
jgi:hypothetical protein